MTPRARLVETIRRRRSMLCVGLDPDLDRIPLQFGTGLDRVIPFLRAVIEETAHYAVAYKANTAFYERWGRRGWEWLEAISEMVSPDHILIADAKRGDVGHTACQYAAAFLESGRWDGITVNPLMGLDTLAPYLAYSDRWTIVLGLTSNAGASDFLSASLRQPLFRRILRKVGAMGSPDHVMFVIGATQPGYFQQVRKVIPHHFLLVPGVGAQGGMLQPVLEHLVIPDVGGLLINASRSILYPDVSKGKRWMDSVKTSARHLWEKMRNYV